MRIPRAGCVHVARWPRPIQRKGQRRPASLRPQLFLPDIMRPTATRLTNAAAHHQHVDNGAIVHIHMIPMVHRSPDDHHRLAIGLFGIAGEFARHMNDLVARNPGNLFRPSRGKRHIGVVRFCHMRAAQPTIQRIVGAHQVKHRRHIGVFAIGQRDLLDRHVAGQHLGVVAHLEAVGRSAAEIREIHANNCIVIGVQNMAQPQPHIVFARALFKVPLAGFAPAKADRPVRHHNLSRNLVIGDGFPFGVIRLPQTAVKIRSPQLPSGNKAVAFRLQLHQHRHVGIAADVILEILGLPIQMELAQDHMAKRHANRGIGALLGVQPDIAKLRRFRIVGADHRRFGAAIAGFGVEMRIRCPGLRHVRSPKDQEARIIPIGTFRHVGLLAPGLRAGRWQVAIPVIERHAGAAQQAKIARARRIADHRHRRDRRKAKHPVGAIGFGCIGIGRRDNLCRHIPACAHKAALAAGLGVARALFWRILDRRPRLDRRQGAAQIAPHPVQLATDQRRFHPVRRIQIPAVRCPARTAARFMVGQVGTGARVIGLLGFPGHDPRFDVDLPRTRPGAVHPMR